MSCSIYLGVERMVLGIVPQEFSLGICITLTLKYYLVPHSDELETLYLFTPSRISPGLSSRMMPPVLSLEVLCFAPLSRWLPLYHTSNKAHTH